MPLPPALAARLARRGLIQKESQETSGEEVFAESYDDASHSDAGSGSRGRGGGPPDSYSGSGAGSSAAAPAAATAAAGVAHVGYPGCPNKWNAYHDCNTACVNTYGSGLAEPDPEYKAKFDAMMKKYGPLPDDWKEQYDPGTGRHFFWCTRTDKVSWLPPGHPKARPTDAASQVRLHLQQQRVMAAASIRKVDLPRVVDSDGEDNEDDEEEEGQAMDLDSASDSGGKTSDEDDEREEGEMREESRRPDRRRRDGPRNRGGREGSDRVDPMDPSSYSDAPRGTWATGLERSKE